MGGNQISAVISGKLPPNSRLFIFYEIVSFFELQILDMPPPLRAAPEGQSSSVTNNIELEWLKLSNHRDGGNEKWAHSLRRVSVNFWDVGQSGARVK